VLGRFGSGVTVADVEACMGLGYPDTYARLAAIPAAEPIPPPDDLWPMLLEAIGDSFGEYLPPFPDAGAAVEVVAAEGILQGVASTSRRSRVDLALERSRLTGWFEAVVAGDQVQRTKPHPDVYLRAAELLGVDPGVCAAVEDTAHGCRSAIAAGMPVLGVVRVAGQREPMIETGALVADRVEADAILGLLG
jgi:beta-phosphoglucomutase-like phosphatase (HAD superfamily)